MPFCEVCGTEMEYFVEHADSGDGYWFCSKCQEIEV